MGMGQQMISEIPGKGNKIIYCLLPGFYGQRSLSYDSTIAYAIYFLKKKQNALDVPKC